MSKYDVVVIGAGMGGLSTALRLVSAGKKVLLLERHNLPGGCATSFVRGRFEFDASLHEFAAVGEPGNYGFAGKLLMEDYKMNIDWRPAPECYRCIGTTRSGKRIDFTMPLGVDNAIEAMEKAVPGCREPMKTFFALAKECNDANEYFRDHMDKFDKKGFVKTDDLYFMRKYPNFLKVGERPFNTVLRAIGMPEDAIDLLNIYWAYVGTNCEEISFVHEAFMIYAYCQFKPTTCKLNSHGMTLEAIRRFEEMGGELWLNTEGTKVVADENGKIIGVETTAGYVETNYVVANMNPQFAYTKLLDEKIKVPEREIKRCNAQKHGVAIFNTYLGLNKSPEELGIKDYAIFCPVTYDTIEDEKQSKTYETAHSGAVCYNIANPEASPPGTTIMTFTTVYTEDVWGDFTQREYVEKKRHTFEMALENFERETGIIIHDSIEEIEMASPWTFANYLNTPHGTCYGYQISSWDTMISRLMSAKVDQPVPGFKTVGAAGANGDGYSQTYENGKVIGDLVLLEMQEAEEG